MSEPLILFENVSKIYPLYHNLTRGFKNFVLNFPGGLNNHPSRVTALQDISFEVHRGETFGIIGSNGAGKSTLLGLMAGVLKPSKGRVWVKEKPLPLLELGAGFHPELTGRENIVLNGVLNGFTRAKVSDKMEEIINFSELKEFIDLPIRIYSTGMLMRLAFSVISSFDPEILLIDEILAVGDVNFQKKCLDKMMGFKKSGVTIVFVSHSLAAVESLCDRVLWIDNHKIKSLGSPSDIVAQYTR